MSPKELLVLASLAPALASCSGLIGGDDDPVAESRAHLSRGDYHLAYHELARAEPGAVDEAERQAVELAYLLSEAQELVFASREEEALEPLQRALVIAPDNQVVLGWIDKSKRKLAERATRRGDEARKSGELEAALLAYHDAERWIADWPAAQEGVAAVAARVRAHEQRAESHYVEGVKAIGEQLWGRSWYHMINAVELDPTHDKAKVRRDEVGERLLLDRYRQAIEIERDAYYGAALKEYLALAAQKPDLPGLDARIAQMRNEVEADALVRKAEMAAFRDRHDAARELLERALALTVAEHAAISDLLLLVRERDLEARYARAAVLELEHRFDEALAGFREVEAEWQGFKDVSTRISSLEAALATAAAAFERGQEAEQAGDLAAAVAAYQDALLVCPGYQGLDVRVKELRAQLAAKQ